MASGNIKMAASRLPCNMFRPSFRRNREAFAFLPESVPTFPMPFATVPDDLTALIIPIYVDTSLIIVGAIRSRIRKNSAPKTANVRTEVRTKIWN